MTIVPSCRGLLWPAVALLLCGPTQRGRAEDSGGAAGAVTPEALEYFEKQVRPLLAARCHECHSGDEPKGNLRLDSRAGLMAGGDTGPAAIAGNPAESLLVDAVNYGDTYQMPPKSKLPADEIAVLTRWVEIGVPWPVEQTESSEAKKNFDLQQRRSAHWCWQPVGPRPVPAVRDAAWPATPVDRFVLARLEAAGLAPAPPAARRTLVRRLYFDLIGLPPTPAEVEAFLQDESPDALSRLADQLLASPHFGERWGRHWLDLVRYAETRGHEYDALIPNAWHYRDYVIRALNADVPYDQFAIEHLAGDLLPAPRKHPTAGFNESILGTGFWFLGEELHSPVDIRQDETDRLDNRLDVMSKTFLALTVACARCHDHKFDAISQRDYYSLAGFLISSSYRQVRFEAQPQERQVAEQLAGLRTRSAGELAKAAAAVVQPELPKLADYLLVAREAILAGLAPALEGKSTGSAADELLATEARGKLAALAATRAIKPALLEAWVLELLDARKDDRHPLHAFALLAHDRQADDATRCRQLLAGALGPRLQSTRPPGTGGQVIVDYAAAEAPIYQDGFSFGPRAVRPGDVRLAGPAARPRLEIAALAAAQYDPFWSGLKEAAGVQRDYGALGGWDRSGRTLRTPEATLGTGKLWYLIKGSARAYAVVNSHLIIAGPLHGGLLRDFKADAGRWQWVQHDLSTYQDRRVHIEFSPLDNEPLAIARVVDAAEPPALPAESNGLVLDLLASDSAASVESLARGYQQLLGDVVQHLAANQISAAPRARDEALLAAWVQDNADLLSLPDSEAQRALLKAFEQVRQDEAALASQLPKQSHVAPAMLDGNGVDELLLKRGNPKTPGDPVPRRMLEAIAGSAAFETGAGSGRLELARALVAPSNPLTARVAVNRVWQHLFGQGIVGSVDNFGVLGQQPSHPELLDYLADEFVREGWSLKRLIKSLVLTRTYQMSSRPDAFEEQDPQNLLLHRMRIRRLEGEVIRDALLAVSGRLDRTPFGPSVPVHITPYQDGRGKPASGPWDGQGRRSIYLSIRRNFLSPMMLAFDAPIPFSSMGRRNVSNVPSQALILMNDPFVTGQAALWAKNLLATVGLEPSERMRQMYRSAFARDPDPAELARGQAFLQRQAQELGLPAEAWRTDVRVWADLAHVLVNSKEFIFID